MRRNVILKLCCLIMLFSSNIIISQTLTKEERQQMLDAKKSGKDISKIDSTSIFVTKGLFTEDYTLDTKKITGVFSFKNKKKSELYSLVNRWISINYNSAINVIQMNDKESGTIIVKGVNTIAYESVFKVLYQKNYLYMKFNHLMEINIKDDKIRIIYSVTDMDRTTSYVDGIGDGLAFGCISLNGNDDECINMRVVAIDSYYKKIWISKKKRKEITSKIRPRFDELNEKIKMNIYLTMKSIESSINSSKKDDW